MYQTINSLEKRKPSAKEVKEFHSKLDSIILESENFSLVDVLIHKLQSKGVLSTLLEKVRKDTLSGLGLPDIQSVGEQLDFETLINGEI